MSLEPQASDVVPDDETQERYLPVKDPASVPNQLNLCRNLDPPEEWNEVFFSFHELLESSRQCVLCATLLDGFCAINDHKKKWEWDEEDYVSLMLNWGIFSNSPLVVELGENTHFGPNPQPIKNVQYYVKKGDPSPWSAFPKHALSGDTSSQQALQHVGKWLDTCKKHHTNCKSSANGRLPTRVLDVGQGGDSLITLYETQNERADYLTLSHCWGGSQPMTTTQSTIQERKHGILLKDLPQTFLDAVLFVRRLKKKFLWIDSLCIIQDCLQDWQQESAEMAEIYQNSWLTIAALKASSCHDGLFSAKIRELSPVVDSIQYRVYAQPSFKHIVHESGRTDSNPLLQRAWVYQERLLSPRVLYFGTNELEWECQEEIYCECSDPTDHTKDDPMPLKISHGLTVNAATSVRELRLRWYDIIEEYSTLNLTRRSDRLPALQGLARQMQVHRQDHCLAGLWGQTLSHDLMWYSPNWPSKGASFIAPSWSWASLEGQITFGGCSRSPGICTSACQFPALDSMSSEPLANFTSTNLGLVISSQIIPAKKLYAYPDGKNWSPLEEVGLEYQDRHICPVYWYGIQIDDGPPQRFWPDFNEPDFGTWKTTRYITVLNIRFSV